MRVRFTLQPNEWYEAVRLVTEPPRRHRDVPFMVYGILGLSCLGGLGDLFHFLETRHIQNAGGLLLLGSAFTAATGSGAVWLTRTGLRKRRANRMPPAPEGEQVITFKEAGWSTGTGTAESPSLRPWTALNAMRSGTHTMVLLGDAGAFTAVPLRALSSDQAGYLRRLFVRKVKTANQGVFTPLAAKASREAADPYQGIGFPVNLVETGS